MLKFNNSQVYIVTGASSGIGESTALLLNELNAAVVAIARDEKRLTEMKNKCLHPENMHIEIRDLAKGIESIPAYIKALKDKYGKFYGMAYCAGVSAVMPLRLIEYNNMIEVFNINYFAPMMMAKGIADRRNNVGKGASLVFLSSIDALASTKGQPVYSGAKAALAASIKTIAKEIASLGVRANCILPSMIKTPMTFSLDEIGCIEKAQKNAYPFGWGDAEDVANMAAFLLSDKAKFISGQNYIIDSGGVI